MVNKSGQPLENAEQIIDAFGGIRPMAAKIDAPVTTVQGWKKRNVIPANRRDQILAAAANNNIDLSDFLKDQPAPETRKPEPVQAADVKPSRITPDLHKQPEIPPQMAEKVQKELKKRGFEAQNEIFEAIEANRRQTVITSTWVATGLILFTAAAAAFLFWPDFQKSRSALDEQSQKIESLSQSLEQDSDQQASTDRSEFFQNMIPDDLQEKIDQIQIQTQNVQNTVNQLSEKAQTLSGTLTDPDGGSLSNRLRAVEDHLGTMQSGAPLSSLAERIEMLEQSLSGQTQLKESMAAMEEMLRTHGNGLSINQSLAQAQGQGDALGQTLEGVSGNDLKAAAILIAFSQMRTALMRQEPFEQDLAVLQRLAGEDNPALQESISKLAPHADGGVLTADGLSQEFKGLAGDIVMASLKGEDVSFQEKAQARFHNLLKIEKDGQSMTGTPTQATVAQAQKMLDDGDIQGAIDTLKTLDGEAGAQAQPFIRNAEISLMAQQVEKMLGHSILSQLANKVSVPQMGVPDAGMIESMPEIVEELPDMIQGQDQVVTDEESGVTILPRQQGFKGLLPTAPAP